jgi:hypothetical protein
LAAVLEERAAALEQRAAALVVSAAQAEGSEEDSAVQPVAVVLEAVLVEVSEADSVVPEVLDWTEQALGDSVAQEPAVSAEVLPIAAALALGPAA